MNKLKNNTVEHMRNKKRNWLITSVGAVLVTILSAIILNAGSLVVSSAAIEARQEEKIARLELFVSSKSDLIVKIYANQENLIKQFDKYDKKLDLIIQKIYPIYTQVALRGK